MMVAVLLGALTLGACVDDNESQSVTKVRDAKAAQLNALAAKANAEAEAETIRANAEAALKAAETAYKQAMADKEAAEAEYTKQEYLLRLAKIKAEYEASIAEAKKNAASYDKEAFAAASAQINALYNQYATALSQSQTLNSQLLNAKIKLAAADADAEAANAAYNEIVIAQNNKIAQNTAAIERLKAIAAKAEDRDALYKQMQDLAAQAYNLENVDLVAANKAASEADKSFDEAYLPININYSPSDYHDYAEWKAGVLPYVKAATELNTYSTKFFETIYKTVEIEDCPHTDHFLTYIPVSNGDFADATYSVNSLLKRNIEAAENVLGKATVGTTSGTGRIGELEQAQTQLKKLKEQLDAENKKTAPDPVTVKNLTDQIALQEIAVVKAEDNKAIAEEDLKDANENLKEFNANLAIVKEGSAEQKAYVAAVAVAVTAKEGVLAAEHKIHLVNDAIDVIGITSWENSDATQPENYTSDSEYGRIASLYNGIADIESLIANCEKNIADAKKVIANGTVSTYDWKYTNIKYYDPTFDSDGDGIAEGGYIDGLGYAYVIVTTAAKPVDVEDTKKLIQAQIDALTAQINIQDALAAKYKSDLEALIKNQGSVE